MPVLYYLPPSAPCRTVLLLGRLLNIEFELRVLDLMKGEHLKPEFIEINPQHTIPTLDDHGLILWESRAILTYLAASYAKDDSLYPRDVRVRAIVDQRLQFDLGTLYARLIAYIVPVIFHGDPAEEPKKEAILEALGYFEAMLKDGDSWAAADTFTVADLTLTVSVAQIESIGVDLEPYPKMQAWLQRCKEYLSPHGYDEIQKGGEVLAGLFHDKVNSYSEP